MEISYSRDACHSYLIISDVSEENTDVEEKMLVNQHSDTLLPFHMQLENSKKYYYYNITGKLELKKYLEGYQADIEIVSAIIEFVLKVYHTIDEYLLGINSIFLSETYLYISIEEMKVYAVYIPGYVSDFKNELQRLAAMLLENTNHRNQEGVLCVYDFYKTVQREDYNPSLLKIILKKRNRKDDSKTNDEINDGEIRDDSAAFFNEDHEKEYDENIEEVLPTKTGSIILGQIPSIGACIGMLLVYKMGYIQMLCRKLGWQLNDKYISLIILGVILLVLRLANRLNEKIKEDLNKKDIEDDIWEDAQSENQGIYSYSVDFNENQTMILSGVNRNIRLISLNKNIAPDLVLTDFPCVVGSLASDVQVVIETVGISRKHACFDMINENLYISDLQSTNGTYINGERLKKNEKRKLIIEDVIELADVKYMYGGSGNLQLD